MTSVPGSAAVRPDPPSRASGRRLRLAVRWLAAFVVLVLVLLAGPIAVLASGHVDLGPGWRAASRGSSGQAPDPALEPAAVVQVYGARTVRWRGAFGIHSWIAAKRTGDPEYTTYQVIGWRAYRGLSAVDVRHGAVPDGHWFGQHPELLAERRGAGVDELIDSIEAAVKSYPWPGRYRVWPGPNSNTFVAHVARQVPELGLDLPPTAIGKDFLGDTRVFARAPSGTGWQVSLYGVLGATLAWEEGVELNVLGLAAGIDFNDFALRLPGLGRVGTPPPAPG